MAPLDLNSVLVEQSLVDQNGCTDCILWQSKNARVAKKNRNRPSQRSNNVTINNQIIANSKSVGDLPRLLRTISEQLDYMNVVNLTTALHRIGKLVGQDPRAQAQMLQTPVLSSLLSAIAGAFASSTGHDIQPQTLSNVLWALATTRHVHMQVILLACQHASAVLHKFKTFELSSMLWAIAKLGTLDDRLAYNAKPVNLVFEKAANIVLERVSSMEFRSLSMIAWAYASAKQENDDLFAGMAVQMARVAHTATCQEMGNTVWAFGTLSLVDAELFVAIAHRAASCLDDFKSQELSNMLWGFASSGFFHEHFFQRAAIAAHSKELSPQHLANILWAFSRVRPTHVLTQSTLLSFLPVCCRRIACFKAQELSCISLAVAKAFASGGGACQVSRLPSEVVSFLALIPSVLPRDIACFSTQSLTNMANAYTMLGIADPDGTFSVFCQEAVNRAHVVNASELLRLFQAFLPPPGCDASVAGLLAVTLVDRFPSLPFREARALSRSLAEFLGLERSREWRRQELRELCAQLAQGSAGAVPAGPGAAPCGAKAPEPDAASLASTEAPSSGRPGSGPRAAESAAEPLREGGSSASPVLDRLRLSFFEMGYQPDDAAPPFHQVVLGSRAPLARDGCPPRRAPDLGAAACVASEYVADEDQARYIQTWIEEAMQRDQQQSTMCMAQMPDDISHQQRQQGAAYRGQCGVRDFMAEGIDLIAQATRAYSGSDIKRCTQWEKAVTAPDPFRARAPGPLKSTVEAADIYHARAPGPLQSSDVAADCFDDRAAAVCEHAPGPLQSTHGDRPSATSREQYTSPADECGYVTDDGF